VGSAPLLSLADLLFRRVLEDERVQLVAHVDVALVAACLRTPRCTFRAVLIVDTVGLRDHIAPSQSADEKDNQIFGVRSACCMVMRAVRYARLNGYAMQCSTSASS